MDDERPKCVNVDRPVLVSKIDDDGPFMVIVAPKIGAPVTEERTTGIPAYSSELGQYIEELPAGLGVKKSEVVRHALKDHRERRLECLLREEGYEERAEHDAKLLE